MFRLFGKKKQAEESRLQRVQQIADAERRRDCEGVVDIFARHFGYIARECITRQELEKLIAWGVSPSDLAANIKQRIANKEGLQLGTQFLEELRVPVKLTQHWRDRHIYVCGRSGLGKTNLLRTMVLQDIRNGNGVGVLAPEQEMLTEEILPYIPPHRFDDVIYVNPADTERPISLNPLYMGPDEDIDLKVDEMLTIFTRIVGDTTPRMNEILYHTFYALLERKDSTLLDVEILLDKQGESLRREIINRSQNPRTVRFFRDMYPDLQKRDAFLPITSRIGRLVSPKLVRTLLCQPGKCLNFRKAMDDGKILLFNLSDGLLGSRTAQLLGQLIVSKIQMAVFSHANSAKAARRPFYLYLDEFQSFVGVNAESYQHLLSRSRKYVFGLVLANQQTHQLSTELLHEIFGNVSTIICFNVSRTDADKFSKEFQMEDLDGQLSDLPSSELLNLRTGEAYIKVGTQSFFMQTRLFDIPPDYPRAKYIIEQLRLNYGDGPPGYEPPGQEPPPPRRPILPDKPLDPSEVF